MTFKYAIVRDVGGEGDQEIELTIHGRIHSGCRGARDSLGGVAGAGPPLEPDEPAEFEIESTEPEAELTEKETLEIEEMAWKIADEAEREAEARMHRDWLDQKDDL